MKLDGFSIHALGKKSFLFWFRISRPFFVLAFFVAIGFGVLSWYDNVYRGEWSEEEKAIYIKTTFQETVFREDEFRKAVEATEFRAQRNGEPSGVSNDFFAPIPGVEKKQR